MHTKIWWEKLQETVHLKDTYVDEKVILKWISEEPDARMLIGLISLRTVTNIKLL